MPDNIKTKVSDIKTNITRSTSEKAAAAYDKYNALDMQKDAVSSRLKSLEEMRKGLTGKAKAATTKEYIEAKKAYNKIASKTAKADARYQRLVAKANGDGKMSQKLSNATTNIMDTIRNIFDNTPNNGLANATSSLLSTTNGTPA